MYTNLETFITLVLTWKQYNILSYLKKTSCIPELRCQYRVWPRVRLKIQNINSSLDYASCTNNSPSTLFNSC